MSNLWMGDPWFLYRRRMGRQMFERVAYFWPVRWQGWMLLLAGATLLFFFPAIMRAWPSAAPWIMMIAFPGLTIAGALNAEVVPDPRHRNDLRDT
jgi:MFS superfamily sulfate permease-like transporter